MGIDHRLATYGPLAPGRVNHHQLALLSGTWTTGTIRGRLIETGWGAALGYPALVLDEDGEAIEFTCSRRRTCLRTGTGSMRSKVTSTGAAKSWWRLRKAGWLRGSTWRRSEPWLALNRSIN